MKKKSIGIVRRWMTGAVLSVVLFIAAGCGAGKEQPEPGNMDTAGNSVRSEASHATEEMEQENETKQEQIEKKKNVRSNPEEEIVVNPEDLKEPEIVPEEEEEIAFGEREGGRLQIVFLGDSILDGYRGAAGIDSLTGANCNAQVYNLAMGGTTAALSTYEKSEYERWSSRSLQGVVHAVCGNIDAGILDGYKAGEVFATCDFNETDYFVIEYGMNDFLSGIPLNNEEDFYDEYTYVGALRIAVQKLRDKYPNAEIVLCSPNYAQFFADDGTFIGDGNTVNNGGGTLAEYYRVCGNVAADMNTLFLNAYEEIGLDAYTADEYLEDGIHLSEKGRKKYAEKLSRIILDYETTKNN